MTIGTASGEAEKEVEMLAIVLCAYGVVALGFMAGAVRIEPVRRRGEDMIDGYDRATLVIVAVLSSAAWPVLLPVYATGWLGSAEARRVYRAAGARWSRVRGWTRRLYGFRRTAH